MDTIHYQFGFILLYLSSNAFDLFKTSLKLLRFEYLCMFDHKNHLTLCCSMVNDRFGRGALGKEPKRLRGRVVLCLSGISFTPVTVQTQE